MNQEAQLIRVLLVDDSLDCLQATMSFLACYPFIEIVGFALSGSEGIAQVQEMRPDLVLMDISMPEMNGLEATRRIKAQDNSPHVILMTLCDIDEYRAMAVEIGADGFLSKLQYHNQLIVRIRALFDVDK